MTVIQAPAPTRLLTDLVDEDFDRFKKTCAQATSSSQFPLCEDVVSNVTIYSADVALQRLNGSAEQRQAQMDEWQRALLSGPGVFVVKGLIASDVIDRADEVSREVVQGPHNGGKNSRRIFAYSEKHAVHDPANFADYYGNDVLAAVCEAWLGPAYQITASINATFKGGNQQDIHRDYHVSHQAMDRIRRIPVINQIASQFLTLQSAIAHTDMPIATGPTRFMPYSQTFDKGYIAVRDQRYIDYVKPRMVQLELQKGDAVFFNPATFHQPGVNETDGERIANLLQVSSPFGRSMESTDRLAMAKAIWPVVKRWQEEISAGKSQKTSSQLDAVIAAACSDYGYPKVFDLIESGVPESQAALIRAALASGKEDQAVMAELDSYQSLHRP